MGRVGIEGGNEQPPINTGLEAQQNILKACNMKNICIISISPASDFDKLFKEINFGSTRPI